MLEMRWGSTDVASGTIAVAVVTWLPAAALNRRTTCAWLSIPDWSGTAVHHRTTTTYGLFILAKYAQVA